MPELAESVIEGEVLKWLVNEGDEIKLDQPIVEVMTDKVTVELPSPFAGRLEKKLALEGAIVAVHAPIAVFADANSSTPSQTISGDTSHEDSGDSQSLFKAFDRDETIKMPARKNSNQSRGSTAQTQAGTNEFGRTLAVPAARTLAREFGVDISGVPGSGPNGRVRVADVEAYLERETPPAPPAVETRAGLPVPPVQYHTPRGYEPLEMRTPLRGLRRAISNQMLASHLYTVRTLTVDEVDMTALVALRERVKPKLEPSGLKLSYLPFIFKAITTALKQFPNVNSSLDEAAQEIVLKRYYNIGMAVSTDGGLIVPVLRDVNQKSILEIAREIADISAKAREGTLKPEETTGSTFSVTNIGSIGGLFSFPIINVPDAAIMGVHSIQKRAVVIEKDGEDQIVVRQMMYLSMSFDHRLVDGAEAARFCRAVIRLLENPDVLMLEAI